MRTLNISILLGMSFLVACGGDKGTEDSGDTSDTSDTSDTNDTSDTTDSGDDTGVDTGDTGDTVVDEDQDGFNSDEDCDDTNPDINPDATDNPLNDIDEDCNGIPAYLADYGDGLYNSSFEIADPTNTNEFSGEIPDGWLNIGGTWATQRSTDNLYGDNGDTGEQVAAFEGDKYIKIWPDNGNNPYSDEAPVYQEFVGGADRSFYISTMAMVHNSSPLKEATQAVAWIKCFNSSYELQGDAQSIPLDLNSTLDTWTELSAMVTCGSDTTLVQAVVSLNTPDDTDSDGDGTPDVGQSTGNVYFDAIVFGEYNNTALPEDVDNDGDGQTENDGDCDDTNPDVYTGAVEVCDGIDNNCSGDETDATVLTSYYPDADNDGYGDENGTPVEACEAPSGHVDNMDDCNDDDVDTNPLAFDNPMNSDDEDCSGVAASLVDFDGGLLNGSFEDADPVNQTAWGAELPENWLNIGNSRATQLASENLYGDNGDSGVQVAAFDGNKYLKIWPENGGNPYAPEAPVFQEWSGGAEKTFYIGAMGMIHNSSPLQGTSNAVAWIKCFDSNYSLQGDAQSVPLDANSALDTWTELSASVTCGATTVLVQAVVSLNTPDGSTTGNAYFDAVVFGEYSN